MHKVYLSPSLQIHNPYAGGLGVEETHMRAIAEIAARHLRADGRFAVKLSNRAWKDLDDSDYLARVVNDSNAWGAQARVAVHSNAGAITTQGTTTYYGPQSGSKNLAIAVQKYIAPVSPGADHGIIQTTEYAETRNPNCAACLTEVAFHSNPAEARQISANHEAYGLALAKGVAAYWKLILRHTHALTDSEKKALTRRLWTFDKPSLRFLRRLIARLLGG